jgi:hypothetical protein
MDFMKDCGSVWLCRKGWKIGNALCCGKAWIAPVLLACLTLTGEATATEPGRMRHGARLVALANAGTAVAGDMWAAAYNPSLLPREGAQLAVMWSPAPFGLRELQHGAAIAGYGDRRSAFALVLQRSGFDLYHETEATAVAAGTFADALHVGATLGYKHVAIQGYGRTAVLVVDLGAAFMLDPDLVIGTSVGAVNRPALGNARERVPLTFAIGASARITPALLLVADVWKDLRHAAELRTGVEYAMHDLLLLRAGAGTGGTAFSAGVGTRVGSVMLDYAVAVHGALGWTHLFAAGVAILP